MFVVLLVGVAIGAGLCAIYPEICTAFACPKVGTASARPAGPTASAFIRVAMSPESIVYETDRAPIQDYEVFKNTQLALIKSPYVLMAALRKQNIADLEIVKQENNPLAWLADKLRASYVNNSEIMRVSITSKKVKEAEEAKELVNAVVSAYIDEVVHKQAQTRREMSAQLAQIYTRKENELRSKRASLIDLAEQLSASDSTAVRTQSTVNIRELSALRSVLLRMQTGLGEATGALRAGQAMLARFEEAPVSKIELEKLVRADPVCKRCSETIASLRSAVAQQNQMALPDVKKDSVDRLAKQLKGLEQEYEIRENELRELIKSTRRAEIEEKIAAAQVQVTIRTEQVENMSARVDAQREKVGKIGKSSVDIEMMTSEVKSLEQDLAKISAKRAMLDIESRARPRITRESDAHLEGKASRLKSK